MKKIYVLSILAFMTLFLYQCSPKVAQMVTAEPIYTAEQIDCIFEADELAKAKQIMVSNCAKCHKIHNPSEFSPNEWNHILRKMIPYTKMSYDDARILRAYVLKEASES